MNRLGAFLTLAAVALAALIVFRFLQHPLSAAWWGVGVHPEVLSALESSLDDQKRLADLDMGGEAAYRDRFEATRRLLNRLQVLEHSRDEIVGRYETILLVLVGSLLLLSGAVYAFRQSRDQVRLSRLQEALTELSDGVTDLEIGDRRRDTIGRIARMVESTSHVLVKERRRLAALRNLSVWQHAARRQAHEVRTPLTALRLEVDRLQELIDASTPEACHSAATRIGGEIQRLAQLIHEFTSFARLPEPRLTPTELSDSVAEFAEAFGSAWANLSLHCTPQPNRMEAPVDRDMLRQVLVNLCENSSLATHGQPGEVRFSVSDDEAQVYIDVADNGPGLDEEVRSSLFEPYVTTRSGGAGMGLGLAISKKVLLDHGGDLDLVESSARGTTFRLAIPKEPAPSRKAT